VSDIDTAVVDSLKALDLERPIREADKPSRAKIHLCSLWPKADIPAVIKKTKETATEAAKIKPWSAGDGGDQGRNIIKSSKYFVF
jgi:hypothetical protein